MNRDYFIQRIQAIFRVHPVCGILGSRQCRKTTLARQFTQQAPSGNVHHFDLENPVDLTRLANPMLTPQHAPRDRRN